MRSMMAAVGVGYAYHHMPLKVVRLNATESWTPWELVLASSSRTTEFAGNLVGEQARRYGGDLGTDCCLRHRRVGPLISVVDGCCQHYLNTITTSRAVDSQPTLPAHLASCDIGV